MNPNPFHKLVAKEDDYTQLLSNLLQRSDVFRQELLTKFLSDRSLATKIRPDEIRPQVTFDGCLRPDLIIQSDNLIVFFEVKWSLKRGLTRGQEIRSPAEDSEEVGSYISFLRGRKEASRWLLYLTPRGWVHRGLIEDRLREHDGEHFHAKRVDWEDVSKVIGGNGDLAIDPFLSAFRMLLSDTLRPLSFSEEEISMLTSQEFAVSFSAFRKLQILIDQVEEKVKAAGFKTRRDKIPDSDEYGFYFTSGKCDLLWLGLWGEAWKQFESEDCEMPRVWFGVYKGCGSDVLIQAFSKTYADRLVKIAPENDWFVSWIPNGLLVEDAVDRIWREIKPVVEELTLIWKKETK
jgi:hypothetical protein